MHLINCEKCGSTIRVMTTEEFAALEQSPAGIPNPGRAWENDIEARLDTLAVLVDVHEQRDVDIMARLAAIEAILLRAVVHTPESYEAQRQFNERLTLLETQVAEHEKKIVAILAYAPYGDMRERLTLLESQVSALAARQASSDAADEVLSNAADWEPSRMDLLKRIEDLTAAHVRMNRRIGEVEGYMVPPRLFPIGRAVAAPKPSPLTEPEVRPWVVYTNSNPDVQSLWFFDGGRWYFAIEGDSKWWEGDARPHPKAQFDFAAGNARNWTVKRDTSEGDAVVPQEPEARVQPVPFVVYHGHEARWKEIYFFNGQEWFVAFPTIADPPVWNLHQDLTSGTYPDWTRSMHTEPDAAWFVSPLTRAGDRVIGKDEKLPDGWMIHHSDYGWLVTCPMLDATHADRARACLAICDATSLDHARLLLIHHLEHKGEAK